MLPHRNLKIYSFYLHRHTFLKLVFICKETQETTRNATLKLMYETLCRSWMRKENE